MKSISINEKNAEIVLVKMFAMLCDTYEMSSVIFWFVSNVTPAGNTLFTAWSMELTNAAAPPVPTTP